MYRASAFASLALKKEFSQELVQQRFWHLKYSPNFSNQYASAVCRDYDYILLTFIFFNCNNSCLSSRLKRTFQVLFPHEVNHLPTSNSTLRCTTARKVFSSSWLIQHRYSCYGPCNNTMTSSISSICSLHCIIFVSPLSLGCQVRLKLGGGKGSGLLFLFILSSDFEMFLKFILLDGYNQFNAFI